MLTQRKRSGGLQVIPAIDILGDEAVRLERGAFDRVTHREADPLGLVERVVAAGARLLHLVDLSAARSGSVRPEVIRRVVTAAGGGRPVQVQAAGGIRSPRDALQLLEAGAARVIIGTAAFSGENTLDQYVAELGDRVIVAIDVRNGVVAVDGWERETALSAEEAALRCRQASVHRLLCTAIERDGMLDGPDVELLRRVRRASRLPVLAAGGIRSEDDLASVAAAGCQGAIVGRAFLDGRLPLSVFAEST